MTLAGRPISKAVTVTGFGELPPEIISGWVHDGPGPDSMLAAAAGWERMATELGSAAASQRAVIGGVTDEAWQGPAAAAMASAATRYADWLTGTAECARQASGQARAAAGAFQRVRAATVPPAVIAANRAMLMRLVATNTLGQNSAAIATAEAQYGRMWTQDTTAMYAYANASAAATALAPFTAAPQHTDPTGPERQQAAVTAAAGGTGAGSVSDALQQLGTGGSLTAALQQINATLAANPLYQAASQPILTFSHLLETASGLGRFSRTPLRFIAPVFRHWFPALKGGDPVTGLMSDIARVGPEAAAGYRGTTVCAGLGRSAAVGALSVPAAWTTPVQLTTLASASDGLSGTFAPAISGAQPQLPSGGVLGAPLTSTAALQDDARARIESQSKQSGARTAPSRLGLDWGVADPAAELSDRELAELDTLRTRFTGLVRRREHAAKAIRRAIRP